MHIWSRESRADEVDHQRRRLSSIQKNRVPKHPMYGRSNIHAMRRTKSLSYLRLTKP